MEPKPQMLTLVRFSTAPHGLPSVNENAVYHPTPFPHVKVGTRRFPWHLVCEFQLPTDKGAEAMAAKAAKTPPRK